MVCEAKVRFCATRVAYTTVYPIKKDSNFVCDGSVCVLPITLKWTKRSREISYLTIENFILDNWQHNFLVLKKILIYLTFNFQHFGQLSQAKLPPIHLQQTFSTHVLYSYKIKIHQCGWECKAERKCTLVAEEVKGWVAHPIQGCSSALFLVN